MRKRLITALAVLASGSGLAMAQGWPANYEGVMLQGFYWDSFSDSRWTVLENSADEMAGYFDLVWIPQSANCGGGQSMGYDDLYWFTDYNSAFGTEAQLRSMINTFKAKGIGTIADVVINHKKDIKDWVVFPAETYKGKTYQLLSTDVCANDDGGKTKTEAGKLGYELSKNNDSGEDWSGMRDLDHASQNVQENVHAYLDLLLNDLGYSGFRYDMVKGYAAKYTGLYNSTAKPEFSVGEYWDGQVAAVKAWIDGTKVNNEPQSAAFDFPFRYTIRDAVRDGDWLKLQNSNTLARATGYQRYSVTFVENHDTEYRSAGEQQDPIRKDTLAANAYMLAMPGTPCVFYKHWLDHKTEIAKMIRTRKLMGIHNQSAFKPKELKKQLYAVVTTGTKGQLLCVVGNDANGYDPGSGWYLAAKGHHWAYFTDKEVDLTDIAFPEKEFTPYNITVHVNVDNVGWSNVNFWTWGGDGSHSPANKAWPGDRVTTTKEVAGKTWYYKTFTINSDKDNVCFVFSTDTGSPQTVDISYVTEDSYFEVSTEKDGTKYKVNDVTEATGIVPIQNSESRIHNYYNLKGQRVQNPDKPGLYISNGRKVIRH